MKKFWYWLFAVLGQPNLVQFKDGTFAVRRGFIFRTYYDRTDHYWWGLDKVNAYCKFNDLERATQRMYVARTRAWYRRLMWKDRGTLLVNL